MVLSFLLIKLGNYTKISFANFGKFLNSLVLFEEILTLAYLVFLNENKWISKVQTLFS